MFISCINNLGFSSTQFYSFFVCFLLSGNFLLIYDVITRLNAIIISLMLLSSYTNWGWTAPHRVMAPLARLMDFGDLVEISAGVSELRLLV